MAHADREARADCRPADPAATARTTNPKARSRVSATRTAVTSSQTRPHSGARSSSGRERETILASETAERAGGHVTARDTGWNAAGPALYVRKGAWRAFLVPLDK